MPIAPELAHHRARVARLTQRCRPNDPELVDARRDAAAAKLAATVARIVAEAPPLTDEQLDRIEVPQVLFRSS